MNKFHFGVLLAMALLASPLLAQADLGLVMNEPNLEKRSDKALAYADAEIDTARAAWEKGEETRFEQALARVTDGIELSYKSLKDTGKAARRSPKYFKRAELKLRALMKRIRGLEMEVSVDERPKLQAVHRRMSEIHDHLLLGIMGSSAQVKN